MNIANSFDIIPLNFERERERGKWKIYKMVEDKFEIGSLCCTLIFLRGAYDHYFGQNLFSVFKLMF